MNLTEELESRVRQYAEPRRLALGEQLGFGIHGIVITGESQPEKGTPPVRSAIKVHRREPEYVRERDLYLRLRKLGVTTIRNCDVPQLVGFDDDLWVIEMTVVKPPFLLDFAGAYLDRPLDFSAEVLADWEAEKQEQFGRHWPEVQAILGALAAHGIFMEDVSPGNIGFPE
jgi:hypothetical protein